MTTFNNFTFKIETSFAKKVIKSILETWNVNSVIVYISFIYFRIKIIENLQCKKQFYVHKICNKKPQIIQI